MLRAGLRGKRLKLSDDDRRRLAVKAQALGREALSQMASVATPATLVRWYRYLIAAKYDGSKNPSPGRPPTAKETRFDIRSQLGGHLQGDDPPKGQLCSMVVAGPTVHAASTARL